MHLVPQLHLDEVTQLLFFRHTTHMGWEQFVQQEAIPPEWLENIKNMVKALKFVSLSFRLIDSVLQTEFL